MPDHYAEFSFQLDSLNLSQTNALCGYTEDDCIQWLSPTSVWVHGSECDMDALVEFLQDVLKLSDKAGLQKISFQYSFSCSKPTLDSFGGGCYLITKDKIYHRGTHDLMEQLESQRLWEMTGYQRFKP